MSDLTVLIDALMLTHQTTGLKRSLYLDAARELSKEALRRMGHFCEGAYVEGRIKCRICGANL